MTTTDPPKTAPMMPNVNPGQIGGYETASPTVLDNIAKGVDPSPKEAQGVMPNPAEAPGYDMGKPA